MAAQDDTVAVSMNEVDAYLSADAPYSVVFHDMAHNVYVQTKIQAEDIPAWMDVYWRYQVKEQMTLEMIETMNVHIAALVQHGTKFAISDNEQEVQTWEVIFCLTKDCAPAQAPEAYPVSQVDDDHDAPCSATS